MEVQTSYFLHQAQSIRRLSFYETHIWHIFISVFFHFFFFGAVSRELFHTDLYWLFNAIYQWSIQSTRIAAQLCSAVWILARILPLPAQVSFEKFKFFACSHFSVTRPTKWKEKPKRVIGHEIHDLRERLIRRRRSDLFPSFDLWFRRLRYLSRWRYQRWDKLVSLCFLRTRFLARGAPFWGGG